MINHGLIEGRSSGIVFAGNFGLGTSSLENHGYIHGGTNAVFSAGFEALWVTNFGVISGGFAAFAGSDFGDTLRNAGTLLGDVNLLGGADTYDGRGGAVAGTIHGGDGDDTFRVGAGIEVIDGGDGIDTLDFRQGGAIAVALDGSAANSRTATDDDYSAIENVLGSRFGNDVIVGDAGTNGLSGLGGQDTMKGGSGSDRLIGGSGADRLTGGLGDDRFIFNARTEGGDRVTDFHNLPGDDDAFVILAAGFGGGLAAGALAPSQFRIRADNLAQDANDRFIFDTTDHTLWFDGNGNATGGLTLLATLNAGVTLGAADILLA